MYRLFLFLLLLGNKVKAQTSYIDPELQAYSRSVLEAAVIEWDGDVNEAGMCVMKSSGEVIVDLGIGYYKGKVKNIPHLNAEAIPCCISRLVLFLALMDVLPSDFVVDTGDGLFIDSITGCQIKDISYGKGGYSYLTLKKCVGLSDVGIMKSLMAAFKRDVCKYGASLRKTGIFFENQDEKEYEETDKEQLWRPCDILYNSPYSLYQQISWLNGCVSNNGEIVLRFDTSSPMESVCEVKNKKGLKELREAMSLTVKEGLGYLMDSPYTSVCGHVNVSPPDVVACRALTAFACFPLNSGTPSYTIGVYLNKYQKPASVRIPASVARKIIDYMATHGYLARNCDNKSEPATTEIKKLHPAER